MFVGGKLAVCEGDTFTCGCSMAEGQLGVIFTGKRAAGVGHAVAGGKPIEGGCHSVILGRRLKTPDDFANCILELCNNPEDAPLVAQMQGLNNIYLGDAKVEEIVTLTRAVIRLTKIPQDGRA